MDSGASRDTVPLKVVVQTWLDEIAFKYSLNADEEAGFSRLMFGMEIGEERYQVLVETREDAQRISVFFYPSREVPSARFEKVATLLNTINARTRLGSLAVAQAEHNGRIQWKASFDVEGSVLTSHQVRTLISVGQNVFETCMQPIRDVSGAAPATGPGDDGALPPPPAATTT